ncbi:MAG: TadE/TadG family type IV pilus assembly protein [Methylobacter sp.]|nr:TadE/TadG family type IV pilus assembly protein [Methylobacter sp.]MDP2429718.1 TadE/TadG family type IV pilus assembly protein [Methylobacter sp.]MDP3054360.1 TadE/TadG family type IV pilus assembly protein [Methylobacter sp.]MDP3360992.1 TadE/TadG family type IV pilus assembly protein [Methylobacter sp.]MDZ4220965.1 TadE/TadG family type IV pilus assembly protein [Methylobacter sp.]
MNIIKQKGTSTVEFAMLLPLLLLLVVMVSEFGVIFYRLNAVSKAVQVATRYLSDVAVSNANTALDKTNAQNLAVYGNTVGTGTPVVPGLTAANIVITNPIAQHVQVEVVGYDSNFMLGNSLNALVGMVTGGSIPSVMTLRASSIMRFAQ